MARQLTPRAPGEPRGEHAEQPPHGREAQRRQAQRRAVIADVIYGARVLDPYRPVSIHGLGCA